MSTLAERVKKLRKNKSLTQSELAEIIGVSQNAIQKIEKGLTQEPKKLLQIAKFFGVEPEWLQTGTGVMIANSRISNTSISNTVTSSDIPTQELKALVQNEPDDEYYHELSYLDVRAAAGVIEYSNSDYPEVIKQIWLSDEGILSLIGKRSSDGLVIINVPTDSMEPTIPKGSMVVLDTKTKCYTGDGVYAFSIDGNLFIKRLQKRLKGGYLVISDNKPKYQDEEMESEFIDNAHFVGKFVRVWKIESIEL